MTCTACARSTKQFSSATTITTDRRTCEDEALLIGRDAFFVLDFGLDHVDGVGRLDLQRDGLARQLLTQPEDGGAPNVARPETTRTYARQKPAVRRNRNTVPPLCTPAPGLDVTRTWCDVVHRTRGAPSAPDTYAVLKLAATPSQAASSLAFWTKRLSRSVHISTNACRRMPRAPVLPVLLPRPHMKIALAAERVADRFDEDLHLARRPSLPADLRVPLQLFDSSAATLSASQNVSANCSRVYVFRIRTH